MHGQNHIKKGCCLFMFALRRDVS